MPVETFKQKITVMRELMNGPKTNKELNKLGILSPTKAISDLRALGFGLVGEWVQRVYEDGESHRVILYHYLPRFNELNERGKALLRALRGI